MQNSDQTEISAQVRFWNEWNASTRERLVGPISLRQSEQVIAWLAAQGRRDLTIFDIGCGAGWLCERLTAFGDVTGTDLAGEVLERAAARLPSVRFLAGDFMQMDLGAARADVLVTLEVLSHVPDQPAFIAKLAHLLKPGGHLMLATQNRFVLERTATVTPRGEGQLRRWVDHRELRQLLRPHFEIVELKSICPGTGHGGILRLVNSPKLNAALGYVIARERLDRLKERLFLGHTLMALARKPV